jgi:hypothetical protein
MCNKGCSLDFTLTLGPCADTGSSSQLLAMWWEGCSWVCVWDGVSLLPVAMLQHPYVTCMFTAPFGDRYHPILTLLVKS